MRILKALGAVLAMTISASGVTHADQQLVHVCLTNDLGANDVKFLAMARAKAATMFAAIGVRLEWTKDRRYCRDDPSAIRLSVRQQPAQDAPAAWLAYALPYDRTEVVVFYRRVVQAAAPASVSDMLAHVFVHEITHVVQGISRHSESGIMKPSWDVADREQMNQNGLQFAPLDIKLIHHGLENPIRASRDFHPNHRLPRPEAVNGGVK